MAQNQTDIAQLVEKTVEGLGFEFVDFEALPRHLVRVTIDKEGGVTVDDCEVVSDQLTYLFTAEAFDYDRLEVTSPGVDRPLKRAKDFARFTGELVHVELFNPIFDPAFSSAGRRKLDGRIQSVEEGTANPEIVFLFTDEKPAKTPREIFERRKRQQTESCDQITPVTVTFRFSDVARAWLVAQLNFKG